TGQSSALARGKIFWDFCAPEDTDECRRFIQSSGNQGEGCETHWVSASGTVRLTSWRKHNLPYFRESGRQCMVLTGVDLTDRESGTGTRPPYPGTSHPVKPGQRSVSRLGLARTAYTTDGDPGLGSTPAEQRTGLQNE